MKRTALTFAIAIMAAPLVDAQHPVGVLFPYTGDDPKVAAERVVHDLKFGMNTIKRCIELGDPVIPHIVEQSDDFTLIEARNGRWVAKVLGSIETDLSRRTLMKMYRHKRSVVRFAGAIGLAMQNRLPDPLDEKSFVIQKVKNAKFVRDKFFADLPIEDFDFPQVDYEIDFAIVAIGFAGDKKTLPILRSLLEKEPKPYFDLRELFLAMTRIGDPACTDILREHFEDNGDDELFRMLICLGDKQAVPLSFHQLGHKYHRPLICELEFVTGQRFGFDDDRWRQWWKNHGNDWQIPEKFQTPWDKQPEDPRLTKQMFLPSPETNKRIFGN